MGYFKVRGYSPLKDRGGVMPVCMLGYKAHQGGWRIFVNREMLGFVHQPWKGVFTVEPSRTLNKSELDHLHSGVRHLQRDLQREEREAAKERSAQRREAKGLGWLERLYGLPDAR